MVDGARGGEVLVLVLALGLLVELELARAATHFLYLREYLSGHDFLMRRHGAYPCRIEIEKRKLL